MEDLLSARTPNPQKKENNTIKRKLQILDGLATSGKEFTEFCQEYNDCTHPARATLEVERRMLGLGASPRLKDVRHSLIPSN